MSKKVTPRQKRAIEGFLIRGTVAAAAEAAGVSRKTVYRWLALPHFREALQEAEGQALLALQQRLVALGNGAVTALGDGLAPTEKPQHRIRAATAVLDALLRLREVLSLEERVAALEERLSGEGPTT